MKKLTIGFVLDDSLDKPDGVQQYILTIGSWMAAQGHSVHYLVGKTLRTDIVAVHSLSKNMNVKFNGNRMSMPLFSRAKAIDNLLASTEFDVLHVQIPYSPLLAARIINRAGPQTVVYGTFHIAPYSITVSRANKLLATSVRRSLKRFDEIVSVSSAAAAFARKTYGITTDILPNVVDINRFARAKPITSSKVPIILFVGRLVQRKGCRILLEAVYELKQQGITGFKVIVGGRGELEAQLKQYVKTTAITDLVEFAGYIDEADKPGYYAAADIAVFPSHGGESFGIVLLEAMAANRPVVLGGDNPGYHSVLEPKPELLFPPFNAQILADKLAKLLAEPVRRQQIAGWQAEYVKQFDAAVVGKKLIDRYRNALNRRLNVQ